MNFNFLKSGIVEVQVIVFNREQLLNALWNRGIKIHNVKKKDVSTLIMTIDYINYKEVKDVVKRLNGKINIVSKKGMIFFVKGLKTKIGILIGIVLFIIILGYLSTFVWRIDIDTKRYLAPFEVREELKNMGVKPGINKNKLNVYELEKKLEDSNGNIMWVNARIEGSTLKIKIEEKITPPMRQNNETVKNVLASMDGEVKRIYTTAGTAIVKPGDMIKRGDVLIEPHQGKEGLEYETKAIGKVIANTFYEKTLDIQVEGNVEERTGNIEEEIYIEICGKKIYLKKPTKVFESYDKIERSNKFIHKNIYYEKTNKELKNSKDEIINKTVELLNEEVLKEVTKQARVVDKIISTENLGDGKIRLKVMFVIEQDIAINY
ncbi:sporulation protein YqfD [Clostridium tarantellae]|uniref:Sporulation protein YqfD n=1 Tax=Clostridium tarantellae TaxID=39493 RepID=A0A6I1MMU0_9CLOT|nr:sporulation protein YqfD [Clostridium tarantellae]MPQ42241.1 sporulation protein YqfD [Clostridium tarantellae]